MPTPSIVFIAGPPKCGTTWLMRTIDAHADAVLTDEWHLASRLLYPVLSEVEKFAMESPKLRLANDREHKAEPLNRDDAVATLRFLHDRMFAKALDLAERRGQDRARVRLLGDKSPGHTRHIEMLSQLYPEAKFIVCVRDVRDAAVSAYMHFVRKGVLPDFFRPANGLAESAEVFARHHWAEMLRFARGAGARLGPERYLEVGYAEHTRAPHTTISRVFEFLGTPVSESEVNELVERNSFQALSGGREAGQEQNERVRKGVVGDWRNHFTSDFGDFLERIAAERLAMGEAIMDNTPRVTWRGNATAKQAG
ncbi:MAG: sulfotransferase [Phycisphaerales bacterium]